MLPVEAFLDIHTSLSSHTVVTKGNTNNLKPKVFYTISPLLVSSKKFISESCHLVEWS